jgi:hypothetical protein
MTSPLITDMSQPLATAAGNALEVIEVMETLTGTSVNAALWDLTAALGGRRAGAGGAGGRCTKDGEGRHGIEALRVRGRRQRWFGRMVAAQGGPADFVERWPDRLPSAPVVMEVPCESDGFIVTAIDGRGAGRGGGASGRGTSCARATGSTRRSGCPIWPGSARRPCRAGVPLGMVHAATEAAAEAAVQGGAGGVCHRGRSSAGGAAVDPEEGCLMDEGPGLSDRDGFRRLRRRARCGGLWRCGGSNTLGHIALACAEGRADVGRAGPLRMPVLDGLGLGAAIRLASGAATPGLGCGAALGCGGRRRRCRRARTRHRGIGSWPGCRCRGIGPISPIRCLPFRTIWWPRFAGWRGSRGSWAIAMPRVCRDHRPEHWGRASAGPGGPSAIHKCGFGVPDRRA